MLIMKWLCIVVNRKLNEKHQKRKSKLSFSFFISLCPPGQRAPNWTGPSSPVPLSPFTTVAVAKLAKNMYILCSHLSISLSKYACSSRRDFCFVLFVLIIFVTLCETVSQEDIKSDNVLIKCSDDTFAEHIKCSSSDCLYGEDNVVNCTVPTTENCKVMSRKHFLFKGLILRPSLLIS